MCDAKQEKGQQRQDVDVVCESSSSRFQFGSEYIHLYSSVHHVFLMSHVLEGFSAVGFRVLWLPLRVCS